MTLLKVLNDILHNNFDLSSFKFILVSCKLKFYEKYALVEQLKQFLKNVLKDIWAKYLLILFCKK